MTVSCDKHRTAGPIIGCFAVTDQRSAVHRYRRAVIDKEGTTVMVRRRSCISIASYTSGDVTTVYSYRTVLLVQCSKTVLIDRELVRGSRIAVIERHAGTIRDAEHTLLAGITDTVTVEIKRACTAGIVEVFIGRNIRQQRQRCAIYPCITSSCKICVVNIGAGRGHFSYIIRPNCACKACHQHGYEQ